MSTRSSHDCEESDADLKEDENGDQLELEPPGLVTVPLRRVVRTEGRMNSDSGEVDSCRINGEETQPEAH